MNLTTLKAWFNDLSPDRKRKVVVGGVLAIILLVILIAVIATDDSKAPKVQRKAKLEASILTGRDPQKLGLDQLLATSKRQEALIENLQRQVQSMSNGQGGRGANSGQTGLPFPYGGAAAGSGGQEVVALPGMQQDPNAQPTNGVVAAPKAPDKIVQQALTTEPGSIGPNGRPIAPSKSTKLPPPNIPGVSPNGDVYGGSGGAETAASTEASPPPTPKLKLRVLTPQQDNASGSTDSPQTQSQSFPQQGSAGRSLASLGRANANREPEFYLPMGSILSGTLLTGVDAPASGSAAMKNPFPALFRIKHEAILPNQGQLDLRECFIVSSAYSDLSSERVYMRAEGLSCQRSDGAIVEASIDAYASGSDGKAGIRGTVVEKTGQLISRSLAAGFLSGLGKTFKPQQAQQVSINSNGGDIPFQYPSPDYVVGSGLLSGASNAADRIATIYEDLARQIVPVVEVHAGIPVDFITTRGTTLRFKKVGELASSSSPRNAQNGQRGNNGQANIDQVSTSVTGSLGGPFSVTPGPGTSTPARAPSTGPTTYNSGVRP